MEIATLMFSYFGAAQPRLYHSFRTSGLAPGRMYMARHNPWRCHQLKCIAQNDGNHLKINLKHSYKVTS